MWFRLLIQRDPEEKDRGYSFRGIEVPLTARCPTELRPGIKDLGGGDAFLTRYHEFWQVPVCLLVLARPQLRRHLAGLEYMMFPTEWCDVAPVYTSEPLDRWERDALRRFKV